MTKYLIVIFLFLLTELVYGQEEIRGAKVHGLIITLPVNWKVVQEIEHPGNQNLYFLRLRKNIVSETRKFISVLVRVDLSNGDFLDFTKSDMGRAIKIDTVTISNHKANRRTGENIGWLNDDENDTTAAGYEIQWSIEIGKNKYLSLMGDYFSKDVKELEGFKNELLTFVESIKIE